MSSFHTNKEWDETIRLAIEHGWEYQPFGGKSSHSDSTLRCPKDICNRIIIYSTAKATENVARASRKKIVRCSHGADAPTLQQISMRHDQVARLLDAAEHQLRSIALEAQLVELLDEASGGLDSCEFALRAEHRFDQLVDEREVVEASLRELGVEGSLPEKLSQAETTIAESRKLLGDPRTQGHDFHAARERQKGLRAKLMELRSATKSLGTSRTSPDPGSS